jgi:hypothetical protein
MSLLLSRKRNKRECMMMTVKGDDTDDDDDDDVLLLFSSLFNIVYCLVLTSCCRHEDFDFIVRTMHYCCLLDGLSAMVASASSTWQRGALHWDLKL